MEPIDWVRNPNDAPIGYKDSQVFVSVVTEIFGQTRSNKKDFLKLRDLLTYLLLRRNPITDSVLPLDHYPSSAEMPDRIKHLKFAATRDIERYIERKESHPYAILQLLMESTLDRNARWRTQEEVTLWILSLWLMTMKLELSDRITCHACLRLYYDSRAIGLSSPEGEFNSDRILMAGRIVRDTKRLCDRSYTLSEMTLSLSYFGAFASLVRASRMVDVDHPISTLLREELARLQVIRQGA